MRLPSLSQSRFTTDRLRLLLRRPAALLDRGVEAASDATSTVEQALPVDRGTVRGRSRRRTALKVAVVAAGSAAACTAAYLWWRHRRDEEYARLFQPEPQQPDPIPADPPDEGPEAPEPASEPGDDQPVEAVAPSSEPEPVAPEAEPEQAAQPVATHAPFGDLDLIASPRPVVGPAGARALARHRTVPTPPPKLPPVPPTRIPSWRIPLPLGGTIAPRSY